MLDSLLLVSSLQQLALGWLSLVIRLQIEKMLDSLLLVSSLLLVREQTSVPSWRQLQRQRPFSFVPILYHIKNQYVLVECECSQQSTTKIPSQNNLPSRFAAAIALASSACALRLAAASWRFASAMAFASFWKIRVLRFIMERDMIVTYVSI